MREGQEHLTHLEDDGGKVTIFSERKQVLDVKRFNLVFTVLCEHSVRDDDRLVFESSNTVH